jgi:hypothetical protein
VRIGSGTACASSFWISELELQRPETRSASNIHYPVQTVPQGAKEAFSEVCAKTLNEYVNSAWSGGQEHQQAQVNLLLLATCLLDKANGSHRRKGKMHANIKRYTGGEVCPVKQMSAGRRRSAEQNINRPGQITCQQLKQVLKRSLTGSASGPSEWTFEHIRAVAHI